MKNRGLVLQTKMIWRKLFLLIACVLIASFVMSGPFIKGVQRDSKKIKNEIILNAAVVADKPVLSLETAQKTISHKRGTVTVDLVISQNTNLFRVTEIHVKYDKDVFQYNATATSAGKSGIPTADRYFNSFDVNPEMDDQGILKIMGNSFGGVTKAIGILGRVVFDINDTTATVNETGNFSIHYIELPDEASPVLGTLIDIPVENIFNLDVNLVQTDKLEINSEESQAENLKIIDENGAVAVRDDSYIYSSSNQHFLTNITKSVKLAALKQMFVIADGLEIKFFSPLGGEITNVSTPTNLSTANVSTGQVIELHSDVGLLDRLIIVLKGDANGDGVISAADVSMIYGHFVSGGLTVDAQILAARVRADTETLPNVTDASLVYAHASSGHDIYTGCFNRTV